MITRKYQFPQITNEMYDDIQQWYNEHNNGLCCNTHHGAIGGALTFEITPTSIGDFITVRCSCGSKIRLKGEIS